MSEQTPNVTTESCEDSLKSELPEPSANTAPALETKKEGRSKWLRFWWIPVAFLVPFTVFFSYMGSYALLNLAGCFRSGAVGLWTAILIYWLWQIDGRIGKEDKKNLVGNMKTLFDASQKAKVQSVYESIGGVHSFNVWAQGYRDALPWLSNHIGATECAGKCF